MNLISRASWRSALAVGALLPALLGPFVTAADAATTQTATAVHGVYLHNTAKLNNYNEIGYVARGSKATVLSSTTGWLHVELPSGQKGYIVNQPYYVHVTQTQKPVARKSATAPLVSTVLHAAYLKSSAKLGTSNEIVLVKAGTRMTVLSATTYWLHVQLPSGKTGYITANHYYTSAPKALTSTASKVSVTPVSSTTATSTPSTAPTSSPSNTTSTNQSTTSSVTVSSTATAASTATAPAASATASSTTTAASATSLPPGVHMDPSITPLAPLDATYAQKYAAVLSIAQSKLGTPYIWGHNEDRGQYGFDCSNYVEYVFHHALGYLFSTSSKTQFYSVGTPVPLSQMQPGDLLFFSDNTNPTGTAHVGIYIGNGQMIEEGGGLGKVGYLSVTTGYWSKHLVAAHRMF